MNELSMSAVVARNAGIVTADMDGETVMMSIENGKYYNLGQTGSAVWALLETPRTVEELIAKLTDQYDVTRERCEEDVFSFLLDMKKEKIVDVHQP